MTSYCVGKLNEIDGEGGPALSCAPAAAIVTRNAFRSKTPGPRKDALSRVWVVYPGASWRTNFRVVPSHIVRFPATLPGLPLAPPRVAGVAPSAAMAVLSGLFVTSKTKSHGVPSDSHSRLVTETTMGSSADRCSSGPKSCVSFDAY